MSNQPETRIVGFEACARPDGVKSLFLAYGEWLETEHGIPPETHGIEFEVTRLPTPYEAPDGALLAAIDSNDSIVGCIAIRRLDEQSCEIKRLFVDPASRGQSIGRRLVDAVLSRARNLGYRRAVLDVGDYQAPARALYTACGFQEIPAKDHIDYPGVVFMSKSL